MASSPDRPFVPHRTPKTPRAAVSSSEFRLAKPFVGGAEREPVQINRAEPAPAGHQAPVPALGSIEDFLDVAARGAATMVPETNDDEFFADFDEGAELPPVEHFLDPLPRVGDFAPEGSNPPQGSLAAEWASTDWQQYDWRSLASLGEGGESAASSDWATTDWDAGGPRSERTPKDARPTAAQAIASALDEIAKRIRNGELTPPTPGGSTDPATLAATLAAILGIRT